MESLQNTFQNVETQTDAKKEEKKAFINGLKADLQTKLASDPDYVNRLQSLSNSLKVEHTLGAGVGGNIVVDKTAPDRKLKSTSQIVGYEVANIGTEPISYQTEVWTAGADGIYEAQQTEKVLNPGEHAFLTRKYMTILCSRPEISFTLANGKIISKVSKGKSTEELLSSFYYSFNDETPVNDDRVKLSVDEDVNGQRVVKAEYVDTFGYLNNPKVKKVGGAKEPKAKVSVQDMMANYINTLLSQR
jgi:hypothetical protein